MTWPWTAWKRRALAAEAALARELASHRHSRDQLVACAHRLDAAYEKIAQLHQQVRMMSDRSS